MYQHKIPIHLDVEDTFIFHLTGRQCMILGAGTAIAWITFSNVGDALPTVSGLIVAALCGLIVMAAIAVLAFYHVGGRGLEEWAIVGLLYILAPKHYVWTFNFDELDEEQQNAAQLEQEKEESEW